MEKPLVSVVLCTYNGEKFLAEQIDSILRQTYKPLELIISDDASTDETCRVLKQYENDPAVRIFYREKNSGLEKNFAFAAAQTRGQLIAFADQDDIWIGNKIERLAANIGESHLVYSDSLLTDESGKSMDKKLSDLKRMYTGDDSRCYILYSCVWGHGMMITKDLLERSLPMPADIHHDVWITYQAFQNGGIKYLDEVLTLYRRHSTSASQTLPGSDSAQQKEDRYTAYRKKLRWIGLMLEYERPQYISFYRRFFELYAAKEKRNYVFPLVSFMLKFRKEIFMLSPKGFASHFVEILKQARGEKA